jgi:NitT/TauT family transport system substrate-binding protein
MPLTFHSGASYRDRTRNSARGTSRFHRTAHLVMNRSHFVALGAAVAAVPAAVRAQTALKTVRIGASPVESYLLAVYARDKGYFRRNGLDADVQYIPGASGGTTTAVVTGAIDVGCISIGPTSNAHLRGIPLRLLAAGAIITREAPATLLVVAKNSPITSAADLNGKTVGIVVLRDVITVAVAKWIDQNGGDSSSVKFIEMPMPNGAPALVAGRVDAYALAEPFLTNASAADQIRPLGDGDIYGAIAPRMMISLHVAMADWLEKNADTARRVRSALRDAAKWPNANRAQANAILARETKIPLDTIGKMRHVIFGESLDVATIQPQIDALAEYKYIARHFNATDIIWSG